MNKMICIFLVFSALSLCSHTTEGFSPTGTPTRSSVSKITTSIYTSLNARPPPNKDKFGKQINVKRRKQLGISDDEDEYDLGVALAQNTDPLITKIIAGSLILAITALLVAGIVVPSMTDYGEGVCNPILTGGRC
eukprot:CAMPEP_0194096342 /NCGR_PEP_ID=MMETSP0149-20130528/57293_1 /TAXON_ID=122233 /ORGANISM="Chaetoceros debilis, Strain MM31A-1" /LENGTH=134 /DNA_ID=CAMNT_0038782313 /DNA_START=40 /DNA_END=444 /DNA_ORIENTATION=+